MGYKSLYRVYRPQTFFDFVGQEHIIQTIKNSISKNKIAHAYLFTGPRGTGKTSLAKLFAKKINCTESGEEPCGKCDNCIEIANSSHPDIVEIDAASNNGVEEVRSLIEKTKYSPIKGDYKIYIIDEIHMMSTGAFNALLKTLEEPPKNVMFILATTEPHKVLPTILSRCQRFDFGKINQKSIEEKLKYILKEEGLEFEDEAVSLIASLGEGSLRDAISTLEQVIAYSNDKILSKDVESIYGVVGLINKIIFLEDLFNLKVSNLIKKNQRFDEDGVDFERLVIDLIHILKNIYIYKQADLKKELDFESLEVLNLNKATDSWNLVLVIEELNKTLSNMKLQKEYVNNFEIAVLKIVNNKKNFSINKSHIMPLGLNQQKNNEVVIDKELNNKENDLSLKQANREKKEEYIKETASNQKEKIEQNKIVFDDEDLINILVQANKESLRRAKQKWVLIPRHLQSSDNAQAASILVEGYPVAASDTALLIAFNNDVCLESASKQINFDRINEFMKGVFNKDILCVCISGDRFEKLKEKFIYLKTTKNLPTPKEIKKDDFITNNTKTKTIENKNKTLDFSKKVFGDKLEIKED